jgi:hypothetical protein
LTFRFSAPSIATIERGVLRRIRHGLPANLVKARTVFSDKKEVRMEITIIGRVPA